MKRFMVEQVDWSRRTVAALRKARRRRAEKGGR
jgi:hypothetical protein